MAGVHFLYFVLTIAVLCIAVLEGIIWIEHVWGPDLDTDTPDDYLP